MDVRTAGKAGTPAHVSRGFTLIEAVLAVAIVAVAAIVLTTALSSGSRATASATDPVRGAVDAYAAALFRDAEQSWKYGSPGTSPAGSFSTAIPVAPSSSPLRVSVSASTTPVDAQSVRVDITVKSNRYTASAGGIVSAKAPLPNMEIDRAGLVPMPAPTP